MINFIQDTIALAINPHRFLERKGFALISTLLVIAVLTIMVVAFMQSMSVDRLTARSYLRKQQAEMAANAGVIQAQTSLAGLIFNNPYHAIAYTNISGQITPVLYGAADPNTAPTNIFLISTPTPLVAPVFDATNSIDINKMPDRVGGWIGSPVVGGALVNAPAKALWINILQDPSLPMQPNKGIANYNPVVARYAYWIEDETAKIDCSVVGNNKGPGGAFLRSTNDFKVENIDVGAIPLSGKAPLSATNGAAIALNKQIIDARVAAPNRLHDSGLINRYAYPNNSTNVWDDVRYVANSYSLSDELSATGRRRINLNNLVTNVSSTDPGASKKVAADLDDIAFAISGKHVFSSLGLDNTADGGLLLDKPAEAGMLSTFGKRFYTAPAFPLTPATLKADHEKSYLLRIAANIRDYIDTDNVPTLVNYDGTILYGTPPVTAWITGQEPVALGKESSPNLMEHAWYAIVKEYTPIPDSGPAASQKNRVRISFTLDHYFEFYNSSTKDWTAPTGTMIRVSNRPDFNAGTASGAVELPDFTMNVSGQVFRAGQAMVITTCPSATDDPPNLLQSANVYRASVPASARVFNSIIANETVGSSPTRYGLQMDQRQTVGGTTDYKTEMLFYTPDGVVESHAFIAVTADFSFTRATDVNQKSSFIMATNIQGNSAVSRSGDPRSLNEPFTSNAGSNTAYGSDQARFFTSINIGTAAPNSATFGVPGNPTFVTPTSWPDYNPALSNSADNAYAVIKDLPMESIGELGNIYDPFRKLDSTSPVGIVSARGGARSLKIGQPDDTVVGARFSAASATSVGWFNAAWRLTDIFSVGNVADTMAPSTAEGKININGVLRDNGIAFTALLRGFQFQASPDSDPNRAGKPINDAEISNLVAAVKTYLTNTGPMMERGELSQLPFFNSTGTAGTRSSSTTNDRGREEIFRRVVEMITTRSASFTVFCIGESVSQKPNGDIQRIAVSRQKVSFTLVPKVGNNLFDKSTSLTITNYATVSE